MTDVRSRSNMIQPDSMPRLWYGVLAGPVAWLLHLSMSYPLVPVACATGWTFLLYLVTAVTAGIALLATISSWRSWQYLQQRDPAAADAPGGRNSFMALYGVFSSGLFLLVTLAEGMPVVFLSPCA